MRGFSTLFFIFPSLFLIGYFIFVCIGFNTLITFTNSAGLLSFNFVGLENYAQQLYDAVFGLSFVNTLILAGVFIPTIILLGLFLAVLLDQKIRGKLLFRTIYLIPFAFPSVVTATLWVWMYYPDGPLNALFRAVGLNYFVTNWLGNPDVVLYSILIAVIWQLLGYIVLVLYSGIVSIPLSQKCAAEIDGAKGFRIYRRIIIPQMGKILLTAYAFCILYIIPIFDMPYILTRGGPGQSSYTLGIYMYKQSFMVSRYAYGAAIANSLFAIMILFMIPYFYFTMKRR